MANIIFSALMVEGTLHLAEEGLRFQSNVKAQAGGFAADMWIPLTEIENVDFKPGGFASGGHIKIECKANSFVLPLTFTLAQSNNATKMVGGIEKRRARLKNPLIFSVSGVNGQLELMADRVRIKRQGGMAILSQGLKGDKEIQLVSISSIQFRPPGALTNGYIQFAFLGGQEAKAALFQATSDENSVMFSAPQLPLFLQMKEAIEKQRAIISQPATAQSSSGLDDLEKLASLRDKGILTEEEFQAKKKQILGI